MWMNRTKIVILNQTAKSQLQPSYVGLDKSKTNRYSSAYSLYEKVHADIKTLKVKWWKGLEKR